MKNKRSILVTLNLHLQKIKEKILPLRSTLSTRDHRCLAWKMKYMPVLYTFTVCKRYRMPTPLFTGIWDFSHVRY
ncbi:hypothetical protein QVD17_36774 [Tagetes erecta]|uniref:Uncharacterized protein n=1 Tax=Tagetes erecta TaxID=13708 RepID=A0AAD8NHN0_TARER|nr:hypothetical protein QVD17_36774 [Tagetes erecta]